MVRWLEPPRERIKNAPEYDPTAIIDRGYEERLYDYHQKTETLERTAALRSLSVQVEGLCLSNQLRFQRCRESLLPL
jgi:hypothetical protein